MTYEEAKVFLNRGYRSKERIAAKEERIRNWRQIAEACTMEIKPFASFNKTPAKKIENCACNIVDLQNEIADEINELIAVEREISAAISESCSDETYKAILEMRYLCYYKWEEIAVKLHVTFRWVMTLHKRALKEFSEKFSKKA